MNESLSLHVICYKLERALEVLTDQCLRNLPGEVESRCDSAELRVARAVQLLANLQTEISLEINNKSNT
jgi:hypothetical protein